MSGQAGAKKTRKREAESSISVKLIRWYEANKRDLPWRRTSDPYRIWLSEVMLQQTRVATVIPYYDKFLARYPRVEDLAGAPEADVLVLWAGLGYYSRVRNMHAAAKQVAAAGGFPKTYDEIRALNGVGGYTAAAIASLCFGLPEAVLDGNVMRVIARLDADPGDIRSPATRKRMQARAQSLLDPARPGEFNQAIMELGATVCVPADPRCLVCPIHDNCVSFRDGRQRQFPVKLRDQRVVEVSETLLVIETDGKVLMWQRPAESQRMAGFWEVPEANQLPEARTLRPLGRFRHSITVYRFEINVFEASLETVPDGFVWITIERLKDVPLSTVARKALLLKRKGI